MNNIQPLKFGAVIASIMLLAGMGNGHAADAEGAKPKVVEAKTSPKSRAAELAESKAAKKSTQSVPSGYDLYHTIREGESLWMLAKMFTGNGNNWKALAKVNKLDEAGIVQPGQTIRIPASISKVALEIVTDPVGGGTQIADKVKADGKDTPNVVTIPANYKGEPSADLPKDPAIKAAH